MIDKSKMLEAKIILVNDKLKFSGEVDGNAQVSIDYIPPLSEGDGYTSLELLLLSLSSCLGSAVLVLLRRDNMLIETFEINAKGNRRQEHPTGFENINLEIKIKSENLTPDTMNKVISISENICPVWAMLKGNVTININYSIL